MPAAVAAPTLGFLTVVQENGGYLGGYLVTNSWGRPLEFRLSTAIQPNRVQQILYGSTLKPYLYADVIGRTLVEKTAVSTGVIITDCEPLLDLRLRSDTPVAWLASSSDALAGALEKSGAGIRKTVAGPLLCHPRFTQDAEAIRKLLDQIDEQADLSEPFTRIREALSEARKLGATSRGA